MLGRLVLILLQLIGAWYLGQYAIRFIPVDGDLRIFVLAIIFAILVWLIGVIAAEVLKDIGRPSSSTLTWVLVGALIGAALITFGTPLLAQVPFKFNYQYLPLVLAVAGYAMK